MSGEWLYLEVLQYCCRITVALRGGFFQSCTGLVFVWHAADSFGIEDANV